MKSWLSVVLPGCLVGHTMGSLLPGGGASCEDCTLQMVKLCACVNECVTERCFCLAAVCAGCYSGCIIGGYHSSGFIVYWW